MYAKMKYILFIPHPVVPYQLIYVLQWTLSCTSDLDREKVGVEHREDGRAAYSITILATDLGQPAHTAAATVIY